ncbi:hypothetical protein R1sor_003156 [Riccia sorocarpa]|uniref:FAD-binding PCMH-type domain-containing protein n=1 Tax=Riccia sorocarpa TaxID=122646 RepID=A0ABD3H4N9_9MARC
MVPFFSRELVQQGLMPGELTSINKEAVTNIGSPELEQGSAIATDLHPLGESGEMGTRHFKIMLPWLLLAVFSISIASGEAAYDSKLTGSEALTEKDDAHTLYGSTGFIKCTSHELVEPVSTQEISVLLQKLNADGRPFKVRATRRGRHTPNRFPCPGKGGSAKSPTGENFGKNHVDDTTYSVTILLHLMNRLVAVDHGQHRLTVEAGMTLQDLAGATVRNGMSVPVGVLSVYGNLTVGGVISASAHGTGAGVDSSLGDIVVGLKWVNGKGDVITSEMEDEKGLQEIRALVGGLGALGVITEVTFQLLPPGALVQVETWQGDDSNLAADIRHQLDSSTPHIIFFWRPDLGSYKSVHLKPLKTGDVPIHPYHPNGRSALVVAAPEEVAEAMNVHMRDYTLDFDDSGPESDVLNAQGCALSDSVMNIPIFLEGDVILENATIPSSYAMLSEECEPNCIWDHSYFGGTEEDVEFTIKLSDVDDWVKDVKSVIKAEEEERQRLLDRRYGVGKVKLCLNPGFFWFRFGRGSKNLLATTTGHVEPVVYFMSVFHVSSYVTDLPPKMDHISEVLEQLALCKYKARPHYGMSSDRVFTHPNCHVRDNFPEENIVKLLNLRDEHDPRKVFESELLMRMLERRGPVYGNKCSLHHQCYCSDDSHCADGYKCLPSVSYPEYKVCKVRFSKQSGKVNVKEEL